MNIDNQNFVTDKFGELCVAGVLGNCQLKLEDAVDMYGRTGKYPKAEFVKPLSKSSSQNGNWHFMPAYLFEPSPCCMTIIKYDSYKPDTSIVAYSLDELAEGLVKDFAKVIGLEAVQPGDFLLTLQKDMLPIKAMYELFKARLPQSEVSGMFRQVLKFKQAEDIYIAKHWSN